MLYEGVGAALAPLRNAGFALVVVTNQSGIARGYLTERDLAAMHTELRRQLTELGVELDGIYHCPHHRDGVVPGFARDCACRKPQAGMLLQAKRELRLDLSRSWLVGGILDDIEAGNRAGCRTILVDLGTEGPPESERRRPAVMARDTVHALRIIAAIERIGPPADLTYLPRSWRTAPVGKAS
jgi:D-glycero-D-manno-heptose 1,7-bisphosphate phosphatase